MVKRRASPEPQTRDFRTLQVQEVAAANESAFESALLLATVGRNRQRIAPFGPSNSLLFAGPATRS